MQVRNVTQGDLCAALDKANADFDGNIIFNRNDYAGRTRKGTNKYNVTLQVRSSRAPGHRLSFVRPGGPQRRMVSACWHAHRAFLRALPAQAEVITTFGTWHPGEPFLDKQVGSRMYPAYASELCECEQEHMPIVSTSGERNNNAERAINDKRDRARGLMLADSE